MTKLAELLYTKGKAEEEKIFVASSDCQHLTFANYKITNYGTVLHIGDERNGIYFRIFEVAFEKVPGRFYVPYIGAEPEPNEQPT